MCELLQVYVIIDAQYIFGNLSDRIDHWPLSLYKIEK